MTGKKKYVKNDAIKKAYCPQIEGLYMADLVSFIQERRALHDYFPDIEEIRSKESNGLRTCCAYYAKKIFALGSIRDVNSIVRGTIKCKTTT